MSSRKASYQNESSKGGVPIGSAFIVKQELDEDQYLEQQHKHQYQLSFDHPPELNQLIYHPSRLPSDYVVPVRPMFLLMAPSSAISFARHIYPSCFVANTLT